MQLDSKKYLLDIQQAAALAFEFVAGRTRDDYLATPMLRAAVERQCEIVGEALTKLAKLDPPVASRISEHRRVIAFRNILIHGTGTESRRAGLQGTRPMCHDWRVAETPPQPEDPLTGLTPEQQAWALHSAALWQRAHEIARLHPGHDPSDVYHALRCLELSPAERLRASLQRGRLRTHAR